MRILLVEDGRAVTQGLVAALKAASMVVDAVETGEEALEYCRLSDFDMVLLDLSLPDMDGYDVVRRLRTAGLEDVGDASVYGTLRRLYQAGALTSYVVPSDEGPHRKYYAINDRGRSVLEDSTKTWRTFADTVDGLLTGPAVAA